MKTLRLTLAAATLGLLSPAAALAEAPEAAASCAACHGDLGAKPIAPNYPILAGQYADYLAHALREYRSGKRRNPIMTGQAANLSDDDIDALAEYFAEQPSPLYTPRIPASD